MWDHNSHYHPYLLRQIPNRVHHALDVGCGLGLFAKKLAKRAEGVDALDGDSAILTVASRAQAAANLTYVQADFLTADLPAATYDVIMAIASLHHMDLEPALTKMHRLLRPAGKLLVLGLYREATPIDFF
jgi:ubiquinone/menaquinone biosynthesis C-methylase UbiE